MPKAASAASASTSPRAWSRPRRPALQPLLDHVAAGGTLDGTDLPRWIEWTCHQALARAGDARADTWLARAHTALTAQAEAITDPALRHGFLHNIPLHRAIVAAWSQPGR